MPCVRARRIALRAPRALRTAVYTGAAAKFVRRRTSGAVMREARAAVAAGRIISDPARGARRTARIGAVAAGPSRIRTVALIAPDDASVIRTGTAVQEVRRGASCRIEPGARTFASLTPCIAVIGTGASA